MAVDLRRSIFQLREAGASHRSIARQLGITQSKVQRELGKRSPEVQAERAEQGVESPADFSGGVDLGLPPLPAGLVDPMVTQERAELEREQIALRRAQLRSQRLEAERRVQLLEQPDGQSNGFVPLILAALDRQRDDTRSLIQQLASRAVAPAPPPQPSLTEQLAGFRQMADTVASFAPPKPPSSSTDLEFVVAKERLHLESQDLAARREAELEERRERARSEAGRNDAVAKAIESFAPLAALAAEHWFKERSEPHLQLPPAPGDETAPPRPTLVPSPTDEVEGECPKCNTPVAIAGAQDETCPRCKSTLAVMGGRIRVRLPDGSLYPPLQA